MAPVGKPENMTQSWYKYQVKHTNVKEIIKLFILWVNITRDWRYIWPDKEFHAESWTCRIVVIINLQSSYKAHIPQRVTEGNVHPRPVMSAVVLGTTDINGQGWMFPSFMCLFDYSEQIKDILNISNNSCKPSKVFWHQILKKRKTTE